MIMIYSTDGEKLFTDPNQHFYIDSALLNEKAYHTRRSVLLNRIAQVLGFPSFDALSTFTRACGVTNTALMNWLLSGTVAEALTHLVVQ